MKSIYKLVCENKLEENLELIEFKDIKLGDLFVVKDLNNTKNYKTSIFKAISDAYVDKKGNFNVSYCVYDETNFDIN